MRNYLDLLGDILDNGERHDDRTGVGTLSLFGRQLRFDLRQGFPLMTTKKIHTKSVFIELLWMLRGRTDAQWLQNRGVSIWDSWATAEKCAEYGREAGDLGPIYGHQWRNFGAYTGPDGTPLAGFDQLAWLRNEIQRNPGSRRLIVTAWNPHEAGSVALPACHTMFQFKVHVQSGELSCHMYQRSADVFLGVPFNIASYALLTHMIARSARLKPRDLVVSYGDVHIYLNHVKQVREQMSRQPRSLPTLYLPDKDLFDIEYEDIRVEGYNSHPAIRAQVAV